MKQCNYIFITYFDRSGSSFLMNKLSEYGKVVTCPEGEALVNVLLRTDNLLRKIDLINLFKNDKKLSRWKLPEDRLREIQKVTENQTSKDIFFLILNLYRQIHNPDAEYIIYKAYELSYINFERAFFKKWKITVIFLVRDGRACYASIKNNKILYSQINCVEYYAYKWKKFVNRVIDNYADSNMFLIKYEELIEKYDITIKGLLKHIGVVTKKSNKNKYYNLLNEEEKYVQKDIVYGPKSEKIDNWINNLNDYEIFIFQFFVEHLLKKLNYSLFVVVKVNILRRIFSFIRWNICKGKVLKHQYLGWRKNILLKYKRKISFINNNF